MEQNVELTRIQRHAAQNLLDEAKRKYDQLKEIEVELAELLGQPDDGNGYYGHVSDAIFGETEWKLKELIIKLKIISIP